MFSTETRPESLAVRLKSLILDKNGTGQAKIRKFQITKNLQRIIFI